jgi:hypothetical protein
MKRPRAAIPRSAQAARSGLARDRKEAAIQLVRLEFDLSRLRRAIDEAERRCGSDRSDYRDKERKRQTLLKILNS